MAKVLIKNGNNRIIGVPLRSTGNVIALLPGYNVIPDENIGGEILDCARELMDSKELTIYGVYKSEPVVNKETNTTIVKRSYSFGNLDNLTAKTANEIVKEIYSHTVLDELLPCVPPAVQPIVVNRGYEIDRELKLENDKNKSKE